MTSASHPSPCRRTRLSADDSTGLGANPRRAGRHQHRHRVRRGGPPPGAVVELLLRRLRRAAAYDYTRSGNPTRDLLGDALSELEGGAGGVVTATGMGAITLCLHALL